MASRRRFSVPPSAARLTESLRDIGYDPQVAVADLVDNSISAGASRIEIIIDGHETGPRIVIADDGCGMSANMVNEALRFGTRRSYGAADLGRYGLGLKTASLSQCRTVTVASRRRSTGPTTVRQLDLDLISEFDEWLVVDPGNTDTVVRARQLLAEELNTIIVWDNLDRLLPGDSRSAHSRRRLTTWRSRVMEHLSMVFHRFIEGSRDRRIDISVDGEKLRPWDPFAASEPETKELTPLTFELDAGKIAGRVSLRRWTLPARTQFTRPQEFERAAGPMKWNRQQGIYIYRADRLVQWGGWAGLRAIDEHTKLARCALDFGPDLDHVFNINVAKVRVTLPTSLKPLLERPVHELCQIAEARYRSAADRDRSDNSDPPAVRGRASAGHGVGLALLAAAVEVGEVEALNRIIASLRVVDPDLVRDNGLEAFG